MYTVDDVFVIGDNHKICEDYSFSGMIQDKYPCAIISDGCSASKYSDIGARILVRALIASLSITELTDDLSKQQAMYNKIEHYLDLKISKMRDAMELPIASLDATIRMAIIIDGTLFTFSYGDGYTVLHNHTTGGEEIGYLIYPFNAPYYFNYTTYDSMTEEYLKVFGGEIVDDSGTEVTVPDHVEDRSSRWNYIPLDELDDGVYTISVMSDGVDTFYENNNTMTTEEVLESMLSFKNFRGEFVQRKVRKFLHTLTKKNIQHYDDISLATIQFEVSNDE